MEKDGHECLGYVRRNPFNHEVDKGKAQCWLIKGNAEVSGTYKDEVKIDRDSFSKYNPKLTFFKEYCGCEARVVHFERPAWKSELAIKRHLLKTMRKDDPENPEIRRLSRQVGNLEKFESTNQRLEKLEGVYDWMPIRPPHRISKGFFRYLPGWLLKTMKPGLLKNQGIFYSNYWHAPIRISKIFKKSDLSAFLYRCLDKESNEENWYLATQKDPVTWASKTFEHLMNSSETDVKKELEDQDFLQKVFFRMECVGDKLGDGNVIQHKVEGDTIPAHGEVDEHFISNDEFPSDRAMAKVLVKKTAGCFKSTKKAEEALEAKVISEVVNCPVQQLTKPTDNSKIGFRTFWDDEAGAMEKIGAAKWFVDTMNQHQKVSDVVFTAAKWVTKGLNALWGGGKQEEEAPAKQWHDFSREEMQGMLARTAVLLQGIAKMFLVMEAATNTDDMQIKLVCAKEVLDNIFEVKGLLPKVSQNLAMRPDLVTDDFVRNKLKETQNANPSRSPQDTIAYLQKHEPTISIPGFQQPIPMLDLLKYEKALSAGSVGQVDLFTVKKDIDPIIRDEFMSMMPEGHGPTVIVKTVFEETEAEYTNDWNLLEQFFTQFKDSLDPSMAVMWKILSPMKESIFDEFDLRGEADFTNRGKAMLEEFSNNIAAGKYMPTLSSGADRIRLTTPHAVATSSKYILIQSLAAGTPLKNFLENSLGQLEPLVAWRKNVYSAILMVYGHMVMKYGFFQSDPHNGNWFWEPKTRTVTLIDWGGVGKLDTATHCKLTNLYAHMGKLVQDWSDCESVELEGAEEVAGKYKRAGYSIYQAKENQTALVWGYTYGPAYYNEDLGYRLFYHGGDTWKVVMEYPGREVLYTTVAELETSISKMEGLAAQPAQKWKLFKNGKYRKSRAVTAKVGPSSCNLPTRAEAYSSASKKLGLGLKFHCTAEDIVVIPEAPLTQVDNVSEWKDEGKRQLGCITRTEEETFVWWGVTSDARKLHVQEEDGKRFVMLNKKYPIDTVQHAVKDAEGWVLETFDDQSQTEIRKLSKPKMNMLLHAAQAQLALAASLYDSDLLLAAELGLKAASSVALVTPEVPNEYVLLARCIVVFHGMLGDVVKENSARLVVSGQEDYIQWFVRPTGDRFFRSWMLPAKEKLEKMHEQCQELDKEDWDQLR